MELIEKFPHLADQLRTWLAIVEEADWNKPQDINSQFNQAKVIAGKNIIFKIRGNAYRLWTKVNYVTGVVIIKKFGTHKEYDGWEIK